MTDKNEAAFIVGYLSALGQIWRELADGGTIENVLGRLEATARESARRHNLILTDESPIAGDPDTGGPADDFYDGGERHPDVW